MMVVLERSSSEIDKTVVDSSRAMRYVYPDKTVEDVELRLQ